MCQDHEHSGSTVGAERGYLAGLAPYVVSSILAVGFINQAWLTSRSQFWWIPPPLPFLLLLVSILVFNAVRPPPSSPPPGKETAASFAADQKRIHDKKKAMGIILAAAIRCKTVSYDKEDPDPNHVTDHKEFEKLDVLIQKTFPLVHKHLQRHVVNRHSRMYVWKGSQDSKLLPYIVTAHLDVVPAPNANQWRVPPFEGKIKDGFVWGRGAIDLKNMVIGWLVAIEDLLQQGFRPRRSLYLALGHDEEVGGVDGAQHLAAWCRENVPALSGGRDSKNSSESRTSSGFKFEFMWDEGLFVVDSLLPGHKAPVAMICCSEKGAATLELRVDTSPGHSSAPPSESAIGTTISKQKKVGLI
jgi:carboxypeptidase PM20D1